MKKRHDPLWEIVGEKVPLQGFDSTLSVVCPHCHVTLQVPSGIVAGRHFDCGLCGGKCEFVGGPEGEPARARSAQEES